MDIDGRIIRILSGGRPPIKKRWAFLVLLTLIGAYGLIIAAELSHDSVGQIAPLSEIDLLGEIAKSEGVSSIRTRDHRPNVKIVYDVVLNRRFSEAELKKIALRIKSAAPPVDRTFILHRLRGMKAGAGAWATTHFNPALEVQINEFLTVDNPPDKDLRLRDPIAAHEKYKAALKRQK